MKNTVNQSAIIPPMRTETVRFLLGVFVHKLITSIANM